MLQSLHLQRLLTSAVQNSFVPMCLGVSFTLRWLPQGWQAWVICNALRQGSVLSSGMTFVPGLSGAA